MATSVVAFYPALVPATGDHVLASVLCHLFHWHQTDPGVYWQGKPWIVKSRAQFCKETAITLDQYKRVIPKLIRQGWIVSERHQRYDKVRAYIRLAEKGKSTCAALFASATHGLVAYASKPFNNKDTKKNGVENKSSSTSNGDLTVAKETGKEIIEKVNTVEDLNKSNIIFTAELAKPNKPWWAMKAEHVLAAMKDITLKSSLESHWKKKCSLAMDGIYQKPLTGKERGQLKMLAKYLGGNEQAKEVISYAVEHWWKFAVAASAAADTGMPTEPHIGYLLKHHAVAVKLLSKEQTAQPLPSSPEPVQLIAPPVPVEEVYVISDDDYAKMMAELADIHAQQAAKKNAP